MKEHMNNQISERRIRNNRIRRRRQLRRNILISFFSIFMILTLSFTCFGIMSTAKDDTPITYKYYTQITVAYGESLEDIALQYMTEEYTSVESYIKEVKQMNSIRGDHKVYPGDYLIVPYYSSDFLE